MTNYNLNQNQIKILNTPLEICENTVFRRLVFSRTRTESQML